MRASPGPARVHLSARWRPRRRPGAAEPFAAAQGGSMQDPATSELRQHWDRQTLIEAFVLVSGAAGCMTPGTASRLRGTAHRRDSAGGLIAIRVAGLVYVALLLAASPALALKPSSPDQPLGTLKRLIL